MYFVSLDSAFPILYTLIYAAHVVFTAVYYVATIEAMQRIARTEYNER